MSGIELGAAKRIEPPGLEPRRACDTSPVVELALGSRAARCGEETLASADAKRGRGTTVTKAAQLRQQLAEGLVLAPGVYNALFAKLVEQKGEARTFIRE